MRNKWFPFQKNRSDRDIYLFCFHHAGGTAAVYKKWVSNSAGIEVLPVELPGNGCRMGEDFEFDLKKIAKACAKEINEYAVGKRIFLYGHSMGAALAFLVCYELEYTYRRTVEQIIVAGRHSPNREIEERYHSDMGLDALETELRSLGQTPEEVFEDKEIRDFLLEKVQRAYKLHESLKYQDEIINAPIIAHFGTEDIDATEDMMQVWHTLTRGEFSLMGFEGTHFFPHDLEMEYFKAVVGGILSQKAA